MQVAKTSLLSVAGSAAALIVTPLPSLASVQPLLAALLRLHAAVQHPQTQMPSFQYLSKKVFMGVLALGKHTLSLTLESHCAVDLKQLQSGCLTHLQVLLRLPLPKLQ